MGNTNEIPKQNAIQFQRFKKNSLTLLYVFYPEDLEILEQIRNIKMNQCILKESYRKNKIVEKSIIDQLNQTIKNYQNIVKLNKFQILTVRF